MNDNPLYAQQRLGLNNRLPVMFVMFLSFILLTGCFSLERNIGEKKLYSLEAAVIPKAAPISSPPPTLLVKGFDIAPMYTSNSFVYRRGEFQFKTDYYNEFIISPQRMITEAVKKALFDTRRFSPPLAGKPADHRLQGSVVRLYGDFRQESRPLAVMEITITLDRMEKKSFSKELEINDRTPEALIAGWNTLLEAIIREFINDLDRLNS